VHGTGAGTLAVCGAIQNILHLLADDEEAEGETSRQGTKKTEDPGRCFGNPNTCDSRELNAFPSGVESVATPKRKEEQQQQAMRDPSLLPATSGWPLQHRGHVQPRIGLLASSLGSKAMAQSQYPNYFDGLRNLPCSFDRVALRANNINIRKRISRLGTALGELCNPHGFDLIRGRNPEIIVVADTSNHRVQASLTGTLSRRAHHDYG